MTKRPNNGSRNQNAPTQDPMALLRGPVSGDNSKGRRQNKSKMTKPMKMPNLQKSGRFLAAFFASKIQSLSSRSFLVHSHA